MHPMPLNMSAFLCAARAQVEALHSVHDFAEVQRSYSVTRLYFPFRLNWHRLNYSTHAHPELMDIHPLLCPTFPSVVWQCASMSVERDEVVPRSEALNYAAVD